MSLEYCHDCDKMIDLDTAAEHFVKHTDERIWETCKKANDWNLSDKIIDNSVKVGYNTELKMEELVFITDVKEFIRRLKEEVGQGAFGQFIDKLAGEKLCK